MVDDLDIPAFAITPNKADAPLIVDANTDLTLAVAVQRLQTVAGRHAQIVESLRGVDCKKLRAGAPLICVGRSRTTCPAKIAAVRLSPKLLITTVRTA